MDAICNVKLLFMHSVLIRQLFFFLCFCNFLWILGEILFESYPILSYLNPMRM